MPFDSLICVSFLPEIVWEISVEFRNPTNANWYNLQYLGSATSTEGFFHLYSISFLGYPSRQKIKRKYVD